ncbi:hypothetical protein J2T17_003170 [Paenibacillus mucilaginosus]
MSPQATNFRGIVLSNRHLAFKNTAEGFEKLKRWIESLQQKHRLKSFIVGMEPITVNPRVIQRMHWLLQMS